jgi:hypothetical protein
MVEERLGKRNPTIGDRRAALSYNAYGSVVDTPNSRTKKRGKQNTEPEPPPPTVPASAVMVARIGGTLAMIPAAAISAQTLFRLALMMGLAPGIAWLLPAALDIYAVTSIWVGFQVPEAHRARKSAIWNARLALALTVICNALSHALDLASQKHGWSRRDVSLTLVSALPPIVVERLLHLQAMIATDGATEAATPVATQGATPNEKPATVATPATATPPATPAVAPRVAQPRPATPHSNTAAANGNPPTQLVPREERLQIVRDLVAERGPNIPLVEIQNLFGGHKSTASRLLSDALEGSEDDAEADPERVGEAV